SAEIGRIERRVPFGEIDQPHSRIRRDAANRLEEVVHRHPARPRSGRSRELRSVDYVDVAVDDDRLAMADVRQCTLDRGGDSLASDLVDGDDQISRSYRIAVHRGAVGEARQSDL